MQPSSHSNGAPLILSHDPTSSADLRSSDRARQAYPRRLWLRAVIAICSASALVAGIVACANQAESPTPIPEVTEAPTSPASTEVVAPDAIPTTASTATAPTPEGTREVVLATAFADWGSTCLNNTYPDMAPKLDDVDTAEYQTDDQGVLYHTITEGYGSQPGPNWEVEVAYTGWLEDGCIFDSSYTRSEPTRFPVNGVIEGWQGSLAQMKEGERRRVEIPPELAYGEQGSPPVIPANATLTFDIILIEASDPNVEIRQATQTAEDRLAQATAQAGETNTTSLTFEPNTIDVTSDPDGFFASLPPGEVTCMTAYAGSREDLEQLFSLQSPVTSSRLVDQLDECLSDTSTKNILIGRIVLLGGPFTDETIGCMESKMAVPTLRPLFGVFESTEDTEQWVTTHFCMNESERVAFDRALYANNPEQQPGESGLTFVDIQECMVDRLGAEKFFARVTRPDPNDPAEVSAFYVSFSEFLLADIDCQRRDEGFTTTDGLTLTFEATECAIAALGNEEFGIAILGRDWTPSITEHTQTAGVFTDCGVTTDFLSMPEAIGHLSPDKVTCLAEELDNSPDPAESSLRAFAELGVRKQVIAGDLVALLFATQTCGIEVEGLPTAFTIDSTSASCIVGKIDEANFQIGKTEILTDFDLALGQSADCAP